MAGVWSEVFESGSRPRPVYGHLFEELGKVPPSELRRMDERLEATMREMGVTFDIGRDRPWGRRPWYCDLLPQIFTCAEWKTVSHGMAQRLRAYECFLRDVYGDRRILEDGILPLQTVLGSPYYQRIAAGLKPASGAYLHLSGLAVCRLPDGELVAKHHYFSNASGISYMIQNRRALARVLPQTFSDYNIHSIAHASVSMLELLRGLSRAPDPTVVLLSPGQGSAAYSEHSFLARRMGIPLVQGGDLLVLNDHVYLKTVSGLEQVEVIYTRVADQWLDPMVFRRDSLLGVPGLVHCIRKGSVAVVNAVGSQLVDDRSLLPHAAALIRYYLGETPILRSLDTFWLGDIDQREMVLSDLGRYTIRPVYGEKVLSAAPGETMTQPAMDKLIEVILQDPGNFVAQPAVAEAATICYHRGKPQPRLQDHILFAARQVGGEYEVFPGALTRVSTEDASYTASELGGGSKDTWVLADGDDEEPAPQAPRSEVYMPSQHVTSRVAEAFYWMGRYLERVQSLATMIAVIETLETEELNPTERTLYRPVWNSLLPPLEGGSAARRSIVNPLSRYRLTLDLEERGSVVKLLLRAVGNAESILECLSLEAWGVMSRLRSRFQRARYRESISEQAAGAVTLKMCDLVNSLVPQFFGTAECTMIADGGWRFCLVGQMIERAAITSNATLSMIRAMFRAPSQDAEHAGELQLSAFLRLLSSRDVYRRVYQMRAEPAAVLEMLWQNPVAPRSVVRCLSRCELLLSQSASESGPAMQRTLAAIDAVRGAIQHTDWEELVEHAFHGSKAKGSARKLLLQIAALMDRTHEIHHTVSDGFLNHQIHMTSVQPYLKGFPDAV